MGLLFSDSFDHYKTMEADLDMADKIRTNHFGVDLSELQKQQREWGEYNFPKSFTPMNQFLGVIEEVGEYADAAMSQAVTVWGGNDFNADAEATRILMDMVNIGERAHKLLKRNQGIRDGAGGAAKPKTTETVEEKQQDAVADIAIFLISLCNTKGWSFDRLLAQTWREVRKRDWQKFPRDGVSE